MSRIVTAPTSLTAQQAETRAREAMWSRDYDAARPLLETAITLGAEKADELRILLDAVTHDEITIEGLRLHIPRDVVGPEVLIPLAAGTYERHERNSAISDIRDDDVVLELGAGLGSVTLALALLFPKTRVISLEANPRLEDLLRKNLGRNGAQVDVIGALAATYDGEADFHLGTNFVSSTTMATSNSTATLRRPCVDVNRILRDEKISVLLMDIEGSEIEILDTIDLTGLRRIVVEFHPWFFTDGKITDTIARLISQGFVLNLSQSGDLVVTFDRRDASASTKQA